MPSNEEKIVLSTEEIKGNSVIVDTNEDDKTLEKTAPNPPAGPGISENTPASTDHSGEVSQSDIDAMITQQPDQERPAFAADQEDLPAGLQTEIDDLNDQSQAQALNKPEEAPSQAPPEAFSDEKEAFCGDLGHNILSQDEINALLYGFKEEGSAPEKDIDTITCRQEITRPGPINHDGHGVSGQNIRKRQQKREENIIREKKRAAALIKHLLRMEEKRIRQTAAAKNRMIDENFYARYEITSADRTRIIVSMSEKTVERYCMEHPADCIYRI